MAIPLLTGDPHDEALKKNVRPTGWVNPTPAPCYQLIVLGAGPAGLVAAAGAAALGARVALVERDLMGGDCLNVGCVPSKTLLRAARSVAEIRRAKEFGITVSEPIIDFATVMERVRRVRAQISPHDSAERFRQLGVDVFLGEGRFANESTIEVNGARLPFGRCIIATGARAVIPDIPGLKDAKTYTNETIFTLTELPKRLLVIGAGPVGCELGQAFARLGSKVILQTRDGRILPKEDPDAASRVRHQLVSDGLDIAQEMQPPSAFDATLVATGRQPNVDRLGLAAAGVDYSSDTGVQVDTRLRTSNPRVFAVGDCCSLGLWFTHAADAMARVAVRNALFPGSGTVSTTQIPRCTYTDPELAAIGKPTHGTDNDCDVYRVNLDQLDRGATDGASGFIKVVTTRGTDRILGATIVGVGAGEMIGAISLAMTNGVGLKQVSGTVFPYPTYTEALKKVADQYNRTRLTPFRARLLKTWLRWLR